MIKNINNFISNNINKDKPIVLGVSTGIDSMVLLDVLQRLNLKIIVAHVNHGKRSQSEIEEQFIIDYCKANSLDLRVKKLHSEDFQRGNFQEVARNYRYQFFQEVAQEFDTTYLCLAHHLNDDIETMIMRIIRGSSLKGYAGINEVSYSNNLKLMRPLLKSKKSEIYSYALEHNIKYFDDESNDDDAYTRNQIRHHIIPALEKIDPNIYDGLIDFKNSINDASNVIEEIRDNFINSKVLINNKYVEFKVTDFLKLTSYIQIEVLFELVKAYKFSKANVLELIKLIDSKKKNLRSVYKGLTIIKEYNDISICFEELSKQDVYIVIDGVGNYDINDEYYLSVSKKNPNTNANILKIWYNSSMFPVVARTRKDGDRINFDFGTKKVKKILIDNKVGITKRDEIILLERNEEILGILGYQMSSKLKDMDHDIMIELREK